MPHPTLGLPPHDVTAGHPAAAGRIRASRQRLAKIALQTTLRDADGFSERYDEEALRLFLRDTERHIEQFAKAIETGEAYYVSNYAEWLVPMYRRRKVPMADAMALLAGLQHAADTVLAPEERKASSDLFASWAKTYKRHQRLAGDHKGNSVIRFFWKGAGIGDDKWI